MTIGLAQFLTIKKADGTALYRWQNYWINQTVDSHTFASFQTEALFSVASSGFASLRISFPVSETVLTLIDEGLVQYYLATVDLYQFQPPANGLPASKLLIAGFTGEFTSAEVTSSAVNLSIGSNLDSTESQAPPRKFTTALAGTPPKL